MTTQRKRELEEELAVLRRIEAKLTNLDADIWIHTRPDGTKRLQARIGTKGVDHQGPLTTGFARILNILEES